MFVALGKPTPSPWSAMCPAFLSAAPLPSVGTAPARCAPSPSSRRPRRTMPQRARRTRMQADGDKPDAAAPAAAAGSSRLLRPAGVVARKEDGQEEEEEKDEGANSARRVPIGAPERADGDTRGTEPETSVVATAAGTTGASGSLAEAVVEDPDRPPGPRPLPIVGNALDIIKLGLADLMLSYAERFGSFVRFSILSDVSYLVSDPDAIAYINTQNSRNYLDRWTPPGFNALLYQGKLRGLVFSQGKYWMQHRQIVGKAFRSPAFAEALVAAVISKTSYLMDSCWADQGRVGQVMNVHQYMRMLTLDIIGDAAFGTEFGAMRAGGHEIEVRLGNVLGGVLDVIKSPIPLWRVMRTPRRAMIEDDLKKLQEIELGLVHSRRKRFTAENRALQSANDFNSTRAVPTNGTMLKDAPVKSDASTASGLAPPSASDFLGLLLLARDADENRAFNFTDEDLMWDVHDIIFAGHETTASALAVALFQVAGSPGVLAKIHRELDTVLPGNRPLRFEDIDKLEYIGMVFNETLRLVPPTALIGRIAKDADVIAGYNVPAGANILMSPYVMGHMACFWDQPEEFRPERFTAEAVAERNPMIHTPFGAGPRICLGARLATMEAKAVLALILQRFTFVRTQEKLECDYNSTVSFRSGMDMVLCPRTP